MWTVKIGLSEESFFFSSIGKVIYMIEQWGKEQQAKAEALQGHPIPNVQPRAMSAPSIKSILGGLV